jgi:glyoxylase-like metal-dependent hydrolase (beta-lactamase superfamily II)
MRKIHFCNVGCADCTIIQGATATYIIDCNYEIKNYAHFLPSTKTIRGVFITHQHRDHFSGLSYLKEKGFSIDFLVYSPYERRYDDNSVEYDEWQEFVSLRDYFVNKGTKSYAPFRQSNVSEIWWDGGDIKFRILAPFEALAKSDTQELHDACLVIHVRAGNRTYLICGDASDSSLNRIALEPIS